MQNFQHSESINYYAAQFFRKQKEGRCDTPAKKTIKQMFPSDVFNKTNIKEKVATLTNDDNAVAAAPSSRQISNTCFLLFNIYFIHNLL